jgi:high affinity sulfate transporter 1
MTPAMPDADSPRRVRLPSTLGGLQGLAPGRLPTEIMAGITLAALMIPLNIGYADVAGLPPVVGLYAAIVPMIAFALFAKTRHLVASPDAAIAAMLIGMIGAIVPPSDPYYYQLVLATTLLCGVIFALFWAFRLGFLASFLSNAVLVGFVTGLGIEVLVSQIEKIMAVSVEADGFFRELVELVQAIPTANLPSVIIGVGTIVAIRLLARLAPTLPGALIALAVATVAVAVLDLDALGVAVLGPVEAGLPSITIPRVALADYGSLLPIALALCAATMAEAPLLARRYADKYTEPNDPDQDMFAMGAANVAAAFTGGFAIGSSASRTAAMDAIGARTQVPSLVAGIAVAILLVFFTDLLALLPAAALAGIVANAVVGLIEVHALRHLGRVRRSELWVALAAVFSVLVFGVLQGVVIAFLLSLFDLIWRASRPSTGVLVELPGGGAFDLPEGDQQVVTRPGLVLYRFGASLYFANAMAFGDDVVRLAATDPPLRWFVLDASAMADMDTTGSHALERALDALGRAGVTVAVTRAQPVLRRLLAVYGLEDRIGAGRFYATNRDAVAAFEAEAR